MKISRYVNGELMTFELTEFERWQAHHEEEIESYKPYIRECWNTLKEHGKTDCDPTEEVLNDIALDVDDCIDIPYDVIFNIVEMYIDREEK